MSLIRAAFRTIYLSEKLNGVALDVDSEYLPIGTASNFLSSAVNHLENIKIYLKTLPEYFSLFNLLLKIDLDVTKYLLSNCFIEKLGYCFFEKYYVTKQSSRSNFEQLPYVEVEIPIQYNEKIIKPARRFKEKDFYRPDCTDLTNFFTLLWRLLSYSEIPERINHRNYLYLKQDLDYTLTSFELKIFDLNKDQIIEMFNSISTENFKARKAICKIVGYASYESYESTMASLSYIGEGLLDDISTEVLEEHFSLIKLLAKLDDSLQPHRVIIFPFH